MKRVLAVSLFALLCSGCAAPFLIGAVGVAAAVDHFDPSLGVGAAEVKANDAVVNAVGPYLKKGANAFFCNKYAQRAYDQNFDVHTLPAQCGAP